MMQSTEAIRPLPRESYNLALNGLRGVAICMVLMVHLSAANALPHQTLGLGILNRMMGAGWSGVDLFFVLSGFLITDILLDTRPSINYFRSFYGRRALRIFPLYYLAVGAAMVFGCIALPHLSGVQAPAMQHTSTAGWLSFLLYYQNWYIPLKEPLGGFPLGHFWSLGVEEEFYLFWPLCVFFFRDKTLVKVCVAGSAASLLLRCYLVRHIPPTSFIILSSTATRADALLIGSALALTVRNARMLEAVRRKTPVIVLFSVLAIVWICTFGGELVARSTYTESFGLTAYAALYAVLVLSAFLSDGTGTRLDRMLRAKWLQTAGKYSYGLYVIHGPVFFALTVWGKTHVWYGVSFVRGLLWDAAATFAALAVAWFSYEFYEIRFLRMKVRFAARFEQERAPVEGCSAPLDAQTA